MTNWETEDKLMPEQPVKTIGVLTGGGDCPGLNAVIRAVTKTAINHYHLNVIGIHDGYLGLIENRMKPLSYDDASNILTRGGTILGSSNKANPADFPVEVNGKKEMQDVRDRCVRHIKEHDIDTLICIGGDGTMAGAAGLIEKGLTIVGVPKTIDNDLMGTDITFGFDTAVATATEAIDKIHTTASSHHRVMIIEVMGRYAGWIALFSGAASGSDVIILPEIPYDLDAVCDFVRDRSNHGKRYSLIAIAEGAKQRGGELVVQKIDKFSPDPVRLGGIAEKLAHDIENKTDIDCRSVVLGHVQRGGTPTAFDRNLATQFGHYALERLMAGDRNCLVVQQAGSLTTVPLLEIAGKVRTVPLDHPLILAAKGVNTCFGDKG